MLFINFFLKKKFTLMIIKWIIENSHCYSYDDDN